MQKAKQKSAKSKVGEKKRTNIRQYAIHKIEQLSWLMGKRKYSSREELYDR